MELGWIIFSLSYLIHVCMEQEERLALLCGGCGWLRSSLDHGHHWNCKGVDSLVGFLSIIFVWLINLQCVQQLGSNIEGSKLLQILRVASSNIKHRDWFMLVSKRNQQYVDLQAYMSFDGIFRNKNCINFYDIYCRLKRLQITSKGWKSLQWLHSSRLRCYIIHMIGVQKSILMFLSLKLYIYCLI
jgi:hypothetical protein